MPDESNLLLHRPLPLSLQKDADFRGNKGLRNTPNLLHIHGNGGIKTAYQI
jgi:hypothetical protein